MLVRVGIPAAGYVHNIWPSEDRRYCVTTEETANKTIKVWDISDYGNIQLVNEYLAPSRLAHNAHWFGNFHVNSHYESGIQLVDVSDPTNPVEMDRVDTYPCESKPPPSTAAGAPIRSQRTARCTRAPSKAACGY